MRLHNSGTGTRTHMCVCVCVVYMEVQHRVPPTACVRSINTACLKNREIRDEGERERERERKGDRGKYC